MNYRSCTSLRGRWWIRTAHINRVEGVEDIACVKLSHTTQTLIVEAADKLPDKYDNFGYVDGVPRKMCARHMPNHGMMLKSWVKIKTPHIMYSGSEDSMRIIHSIVPNESRKRTRDTE